MNAARRAARLVWPSAEVNRAKTDCTLRASREPEKSFFGAVRRSAVIMATVAFIVVGLSAVDAALLCLVPVVRAFDQRSHST